MTLTQWLKIGLYSLAVPFFTTGGCLIAGCSDQGQNDNVMRFLQEGGAAGDLSMSSGGSPLSAGMKQTFFLGPENASFSFDGKIDFSGEPNDANGT